MHKFFFRKIYIFFYSNVHRFIEKNFNLISIGEAFGYIHNNQNKIISGELIRKINNFMGEFIYIITYLEINYKADYFWTDDDNKFYIMDESCFYENNKISHLCLMEILKIIKWFYVNDRKRQKLNAIKNLLQNLFLVEIK